MQRRRSGHWGLLWAIPIISLAAEQAPPEGALGLAILFIGVQLVSCIGHGAASLSEWAAWTDTTGTALEVTGRRLKLLQGLILSILAGNVCFYGGQYWGNVSEIPALIGSGVAAYGGDRFLTPILTRLTGRPNDHP